MATAAKARTPAEPLRARVLTALLRGPATAETVASRLAPPARAEDVRYYLSHAVQRGEAGARLVSGVVVYHAGGGS